MGRGLLFLGVLGAFSCTAPERRAILGSDGFDLAAGIPEGDTLYVQVEGAMCMTWHQETVRMYAAKGCASIEGLVGGDAGGYPLPTTCLRQAQHGADTLTIAYALKRGMELGGPAGPERLVTLIMIHRTDTIRTTFAALEPLALFLGTWEAAMRAQFPGHYPSIVPVDTYPEMNTLDFRKVNNEQEPFQ